jgi:hypothetical protein
MRAVEVGVGGSLTNRANRSVKVPLDPSLSA